MQDWQDAKLHALTAALDFHKSMAANHLNNDLPLAEEVVETADKFFEFLMVIEED